MKRMKRILATTFALALTLSLAVPVAFAADDHFVDVNVKDTDSLLLNDPSFQLRDWDWAAEEDSMAKLPAETFTPDYTYKLPIGASLNITLDRLDSLFLSAWSDPDGDGVYDARITENEYLVDLDTDQATLLPASYPGPVTPTLTTSYMGEWPIYGNNNISFTYLGGQELENVRLSAAYLSKTFGTNTLIELQYIPDDSTDYVYYYLLLTGEKIDPTLLEGNNLSLSNSGAAVSGWAVDTINSAETAKLVPDSLFGADLTQNATRSDFAGASVKLYEAMSGQSAPDVSKVDPFEDASDIVVRQAYALGFINGVGEGKFAPNDPLTREQAAVILARVYEKIHGSLPAGGNTNFADNAAISSWSQNAVAFMSGKSIVGGVGGNRFDPQGNTTGEQALAIALRMFQYFEKYPQA